MLLLLLMDQVNTRLLQRQGQVMTLQISFFDLDMLLISQLEVVTVILFEFNDIFS